MGKYIYDFSLPGGGLKTREQYENDQNILKDIAIPLPAQSLYKAEDWKPTELPELNTPVPPVNMASYHTADIATDIDDQQIIDKIIQAGKDQGIVIPRLSEMTPGQLASAPKVEQEPGLIDKMKQAWNYGEGQKTLSEGYGVKWDNSGIGGDDLIKQGQNQMNANSSVMKYAYNGDISEDGGWMKALSDPNYWAVNLVSSLPSSWDIAKKQLVTGVAGKLLMATGIGLLPGVGVQAAGVAAATHTEAKMEGQSVYEQIYNEELNRGSSVEAAHQKAKNAADETYIKNIAILAPTNALEVLTVFGVGADVLSKAVKIAKASPNIQRAAGMAVAMADKVGPVATGAAKEVGRFALTAGTEAAQEGVQYIASQSSMDKDWDLGKEFQENALAGAAMGGGMHVAGRLASAAIDRGKATTTPDNTAIPPGEVNPAPVGDTLPSGQPQEEAEQPGVGISITPQASTSEPQGDLGPVRLTADTTTPTQNIVASHILDGVNKDESWDKLGEIRGGIQGMDRDEFDDLYDAVDEFYKQEEAKSTEQTPIANIDVSPEATEKVTKIQAIAETRYGKDNIPKDSYEIIDTNNDESPEVALMKAYAKTSGKDLVVVNPKSEEASKFNGFIDDGMNAIIINNKADNPIHTVMAHEITHDMEMTTKDIYNAFVGAIDATTGVNGGIERWHNDNHVNKFGGRTWKQLNTNEKKGQTSEFLADLMQEQSSIKGFYDGLLKKSVGAAKEFLKSIDSVITRLKGMPIDERYSVRQYIEHWEQARDICQRSLIMYTNEKLKVPEIKKPEVKVEQKKSTPVPPPKTPKKELTQEEKDKKREEYNRKRREKRAEEKQKKQDNNKPPEDTSKEIETKKEQLAHINDPAIGSKYKHSIGSAERTRLEESEGRLKKEIAELEKQPKVEPKAEPKTEPKKETVREKMIREQRERQAANGAKFSDKLGSISSDDYRDYAIEGMAILLEDSGISRKKWDERMLSTFGKQLDFYLDGIYVTSQKLLVMSDGELENFIVDEPKVEMKKSTEEPIKSTQSGDDVVTDKEREYWDDLIDDDYITSKLDTTRLTHEEERELGHKAQAGDSGALLRLVGAYNKLVYKIANRYILNNHDLTLEDLAQEGRIWLIMTIMDKKKYDPDKPTRLYGPANANIKHGIYRYMNTLGRTTRIPEYLAGYYSFYLDTSKNLRDKLGHTPDIDEIYDAMKNDPSNSKTRQKWLDEHTIDDMLQIIQDQQKQTSLNTPVGEDSDMEMLDFVTTEMMPKIEKETYLSDLRESIGNAIYENLSDNQRDAILIRYMGKYIGVDDELIDKKSGLVELADVAKIMAMMRVERGLTDEFKPISGERVRQHIKKGLDKLKSSKELDGYENYMDNDDAKFSDKFGDNTKVDDSALLDAMMFGDPDMMDPLTNREQETMEVARKIVGTTKFSDKRDSGFISRNKELFSEQTTNEILDIMMNTDDAKYTKSSFEEWTNFANSVIRDNSLSEATRIFRTKKLEPGQKTALGLKLSMALDQKAMELYNAGKYDRSMRYSMMAKDVAVENSIHLSKAGQEVVSAKLLEKFTPHTVLSEMQRLIDRQYKSYPVKFKRELEGMVNQVHSGINDINNEAIDELIESLRDEIKYTDRRKTNVVLSESTIDNTIVKIERHVEDSGEKDTPVKYVVKQMNDMFKGWFSDKPGSKPDGDYATEIVRRFLREDPSVEGKWGKIKDNLIKDYGEIFNTPQEFFDYYLTRPESETTLNSRIAKSLKTLEKAGRIPSLNSIYSDKDINAVVNELMKTNKPQFKPAIIARVKKLINKSKEDHVERLAKRIVMMAKNEPASQKENKIRDMMNMIVKIAREELPKREIIPKDPMDLIIKAFENQQDYKDMWNDTKDAIKEKYPNMVDELAALQQFFDRPINDFISKQLLGKAITKGFKGEGISIEDIVKKHYSEQTLAIESLSEKLVNQAGLIEDDAEALAKMIEDKFTTMTKDKKEKLLNKIFNKGIKKGVRQTLIDRIIIYSNLGAFDQEQYRNLVCEKMGMTVITPEMSRDISRLCDAIQTAEYRSELSGDGKYEVQWTTTYKYMLLYEGNEIGRYNTLDEAHDHAPEEIKWTDNPRLIGSELKDERIMELKYIINTANRPNTLRKVATAQTVAMLLNLQTMTRNIVGNELLYRVNRSAKIISVPVDMARSKITGTERRIVFSHNKSRSSYWKGLVSGSKYAYRGFTPRGLEGQYELGFNPSFDKSGWFVKNTLGFLEKLMRVTLLGMDQAAITRAYEDKISELAVLQCINSGQKVNKANIERFINKMDKNLQEQAVEYAKRMTFQNDNRLTKTASNVKRGLNFGQDFGIGDVLMKFTKVPANLTLLALDFSPFGFLRGIHLALREFLPENLGGGERDITRTIEAFSEALIGTVGFTGFGLWMAMMGVMTGKEDDDPRKKIYDRSLGKGLYKFNISAFNRYVLSGFDKESCEWKDGDNVVGYSWMEPLSTSMAMGVSVAKEMKKLEANGETWNLLDAATAAISWTSFREGMGVVFDRSIFEGMNSIFEAKPGTTLDGAQIIENIKTDFIVNAPASFIPAVVRQARVIIDPYARVTWEGDNIWDTSLNKMKDKLPGLSKTLVAQEDYFGAPMEKNVGMKDNKVANIGMNLVLPMYINKFQVPSESSRKIIYDIHRQSGSDVWDVESEDPNALPGVMSTSITINKTKVKLTNDEYRELKEIRGEEIDRLIQKSSILKSNKPIQDKIDRLHEIYIEAGKNARDEMRKDIKESRGLK